MGPFVLLLAVSVYAAPVPTCVKKTKLGYDEPKTFAGLIRCQEKARGGVVDESVTDAQQAEAREYLKRHPERASTTDEKLKPEVAAQKKRSQEAVLNNAVRLPEEEREGYQELSDKLWGMSGDGEKGLTPDMAKEIAGYLQKQQGGVSVEMQALLGSLEKDGSKLSHGSVRKLKKAARDAKGEGLDIGIADEGMEKWLLDPATDPKPGEKGPYPGQEDSGEPPSN
ncbi:hypothetical protein EPO15_05165 [bacterium]|nr:MAG: hypothetical protein EPO15_05165 [bacterium]